MNEVSIIINGVRYDAVEGNRLNCINCDIVKYCHSLSECCLMIEPNQTFKESTKSFEKMRTIKFRGRKNNGEWIYGDLIHNRHEPGEVYIQDEKGLGSDVPLETVGQFTGLYDKDGKEIYEGDIIMSDRNREAVYHEVHYNEDEASFYAALNGKKDLFFGDCHIRREWIQRFEKRVIGNVHDNPELLKGGNQ